MPGYDHIEDFRCNPSHITGKQQNPGKDKSEAISVLPEKPVAVGNFCFSSIVSITN